MTFGALGVVMQPCHAQGQPLEPSDIFNLEFAADPQISPDGGRIVYVRRFADVMTDSRHSNLWILNSDGSNHRPLTTGKYDDGSPRWSPDGTRLAFLSDRGGKIQIHVRWMESGITSEITNVTEEPAGLAWSPDGERIAFAKLVPTEAPQIEGMPARPDGAEWAEPARVINRLVYRFDQIGYLPHGYMHLFVVPASGGTARQVSGGDFHYGGIGIGGAFFDWSPDGEFLIASSNRESGDRVWAANTDVYEISVADGEARQLTRRSGPDDAPVVSPDNRFIAYLGYDDREQGYQNTYLYLMNRDGSEPRRLSAALDRSVEGAQWAPNSRGVYAMYEDAGKNKLALFSLDGSYSVIAENLGGTGSAYGGGGTFSYSQDGDIAYSFSTTNQMSDVAVIDGGDARPVTGINDDVFENKSIGDVEEIWWESSYDGLRIQGWIIKPPGFDPTRKYPLVLEIHGGPFAAYGPRFDIEKQLMAAQGNVVLYANPRGSTSYGEQFGNAIHHSYPGNDLHDLLSGVDAVVERGFIDDEHLYVVGGSGGGVLTAWVIGHTDRFRAAVSWYPVINWYSFNLTADMAPYSVKYWFPGLPWDNVDHYESRSLLSVVENVTTPTMIMTGEEDYRTPMSESEQYFKALKMLGVETVLVRVPGEPHGIRRQPSHHVAKMVGTLGWFRRHMKPTS
jgi:acylaminoacyl-peptidase